MPLRRKGELEQAGPGPCPAQARQAPFPTAPGRLAGWGLLPHSVCGTRLTGHVQIDWVTLRGRPLPAPQLWGECPCSRRTLRAQRPRRVGFRPRSARNHTPWETARPGGGRLLLVAVAAKHRQVLGVTEQALWGWNTGRGPAPAQSQRALQASCGGERPLPRCGRWPRQPGQSSRRALGASRPLGTQLLYRPSLYLDGDPHCRPCTWQGLTSSSLVSPLGTQAWPQAWLTPEGWTGRGTGG